MGLDKLDVVDKIGIEKETGIVKLSIIDSLDWEEEQDHLYLLQEKINHYLSFIESGEIYNSYPGAKGKIIGIRIIAQHDLTVNANNFFVKVKEVINNAGFDFDHIVI